MADSVPRLPLFALADTPKRYDWFYNPKPENEAPWAGPGSSHADPWERLDAQPLVRRVAALFLAFEDLPAQARRFLRWRALRLKARAAGRHVFISPMRVGSPPGSPARRAPKRVQERPENDSLRELDWFARDVLNRLDTS